MDDLAPLQSPPEFADAPTVLAEDDNAACITPGIHPVPEKEDVDHVETIENMSVLEEHSVRIGVQLTVTAVHLDTAVPTTDPDPAPTVESDATRC